MRCRRISSDIPSQRPRTIWSATHASISAFFGAGGLYAWEISRGGRDLKVRVDGALTFNRVPLILDAAAAGHGIAFVLEDWAAPFVADGRLTRVLEDWCEPFDGYDLYYPSRGSPRARSRHSWKR